MVWNRSITSEVYTILGMVSDDSLLKMLYLAMMDITKKMDEKTARLERDTRPTGGILR